MTKRFLCLLYSLSVLAAAKATVDFTAFNPVFGGLNASGEALKFYNAILDSLIPWKTFTETVERLKKYQHDYSTEAGKLVGEINTLMLNSEDKYYTSTRNVYEWCSLAVKLLTGYLKLFENYNQQKAEAQKVILLRVFDDGIQKMNEAQANLEQCSTSFNEMAGKLSELNTRLGHDFDSKSSYFQSQVSRVCAEANDRVIAGAGVASTVGMMFGPVFGVIGGIFGFVVSKAISDDTKNDLIDELNRNMREVKSIFEKFEEIIKKADTSIGNAKMELKQEIVILGEMKVQTEETKMWVMFDDLMVNELKESANKLIELCMAYMKRHEAK